MPNVSTVYAGGFAEGVPGQPPTKGLNYAEFFRQLSTTGADREPASPDPAPETPDAKLDKMNSFAKWRRKQQRCVDQVYEAQVKILEALPSRPLDREALWSHNNQPNSFCAGIISILVDLSAETFLDVCSKREDMRILNASVRQAEVAGCNAGASPSTAQSPQSPRSPYPQFGVPPGQPSPVAKAPLAESVADLDTVALAYDLTSGIIGHAVKALLRVHKFVRLASALSEPSSLIKAMTAEMLAEQERPLDEYLKATPPGPEKTVGQRHGRKATALNDRLRCALGLPTEPETPTRPPSSRLSPRPPKTVSPRPPALSVSPAAEDPGASVPKVRPSTAPAASFLAHARYTTKPLPKSRIRHRRISQEPIAGPPPARPGPTPAPAYVEIPQTSPYAARAVERGLVQPPDVELSSVIESTEAVEAVAHRELLQAYQDEERMRHRIFGANFSYECPLPSPPQSSEIKALTQLQVGTAPFPALLFRNVQIQVQMSIDLQYDYDAHMFNARRRLALKKKEVFSGVLDIHQKGKLLLFKRNDDLIVRQLNACNRKLITGTLRIRRCLQEREANGGHMPQHLSSHFVYLQSMYISILGEKYQLIAQREKNLIALAFLDTAQFQVNLV